MDRPGRFPGCGEQGHAYPNPVDKPRGELVPRPFTTVSNDPDPEEVQAVVDQLKAFGRASAPFQMTVDQACELLDAVLCAYTHRDDGTGISTP